MPWDENWFTDPEVIRALGKLEAHYAILGTGLEDPRFDAFLRDIQPYQTEQARDTLRPAFQALAAAGLTEHTACELAWGSLLTFLEPATDFAELLDCYCLADDAVARPGAFGREWARRTCDAAWTVWIAAAASEEGRRHADRSPHQERDGDAKCRTTRVAAETREGSARCWRPSHSTA
ncbi:hypothetical protein [Streptomyces sp. NPDC017529]|uniref:hypothetical protein n=1 Tax=Streptomyces sp. NPDC017529 TaxID=3365000 RepID=UPI0037A1B55B